LTEAVRRRPYSVVLFDEIEKAHPEVLNVLLQVLDDGRLTDGKGRTIDFRQTVIIMTSNIGSQYIAEQAQLAQKQSGKLDEDTRRQIMEALREHFRPEFINRVDDIIIFHPLGREHIEQIIDIQLRRLMQRLQERKIAVDLTPAAKAQLIEEGYDPVYGARPLKRVIQRRILDPLAMRVLEGDFGEGDVIRVDAAGGELRFSRRERAAASRQ
jgi:ATP-dependent Clp protease ATP-binding subunit ClpB